MESQDTVFPTGIRDVDQEILSRLNAESIDKACTTNVYTSTLCDNLFWRRKFTRDYVDIGILDNYSELYHTISKMNDYNSILIFSANEGYLNLFKFAIDNGADMHTKEDLVFLVAARYGHIDIVKFIIQNSIIDQNNKSRALLNASAEGHLDIINYLLDNGTDINTALYEDQTPLGEASRTGKIEAVKLLIDRGADIRLNSCDALDRAASNGYLDIVKILVEAGIDLQTDENYALARAAESGHLDIMKYLIEHDANVNDNREPPIVYAARGGYIDAVKLLIDSGADIHINNDKILKMAEGFDMLIYLLDNYKFNLETALIYATNSRNRLLMGLLLDRGANVHINDDEPLLLAIQFPYNTEIIELLIKYGANVNVSEGEPLIYLSRTRLLGNAKLLLKRGACLNLERFRQNDKAINNRIVQIYLKSELSKNNICILDKKTEESKICLGITKKGVQCKNKPVQGSIYCRVHQKYQ